MRVSQTTSNQIQNAEATSSKGVDRASQAKNAKKADKSQASTESTDSANTSISSKAKDFAKAKAVASHAPDVREEKIAELKKRIAAGKYKIDDDAVADKLVDDHIKMSGIG
jgi:negative regulator of flagellin synthesis FlgM